VTRSQQDTTQIRRCARKRLGLRLLRWAARPAVPPRASLEAARGSSVEEVSSLCRRGASLPTVRVMVRLMAPCALSLVVFAGCSSETTSSNASDCRPTPNVRATRGLVPHTIVVTWSVKRPTRDCGPARLLISALSMRGQSGAVWADGSPAALTAGHGTDRIHLRMTDEPPYRVTVSVFTAKGRGESRPVPVTGEHQPTEAQQRKVRKGVAACRPLADSRKTCLIATRHRGGRRTLLKGFSAVELSGAVRRQIESAAGADERVVRVGCTASGTCTVSFATNHGKYRAQVRLWLGAAPDKRARCYELTRWAVLRPLDPSVAHTAGVPLLRQGCVY
jgi:hypothetical protein